MNKMSIGTVGLQYKQLKKKSHFDLSVLWGLMVVFCGVKCPEVLRGCKRFYIFKEKVFISSTIRSVCGAITVTLALASPLVLAALHNLS